MRVLIRCAVGSAISVCKDHACAGSTSAPVRHQAARAISALVQGQVLLSAQSSQAKYHILLAACCDTEACMAEGSIPSPWNLPEAEQPLKSMQTSSGAGLELLPDLALLEALAEQLVFQATGQEHAEVHSGLHTLSM